jgi:hypothetical protein
MLRKTILKEDHAPMVNTSKDALNTSLGETLYLHFSCKTVILQTTLSILSPNFTSEEEAYATHLRSAMEVEISPHSWNPRPRLFSTMLN